MFRFAVVVPLFLATSPLFAALKWEKTDIAITAAPLDEQAVAVFKFTNAGDTTVTVTSVETSCGCTVPELEKKIYTPGETGELRAVFTFGGRTGHQTKAITVITDEFETSQYDLSFEIGIPRLFDVRPYFVLWHRGDTIEEKVISIQVLFPDLIHPVSVETSNTRFSVGMEKSSEETNTYLIAIRPDTTKTEAQATIVVKTNAPENDPQVITLYGLVR